MSAYAEFHKLASAVERIRASDRAEFYRRLDDAACAAMQEAQERGGWSRAAEVWHEWNRVPRPPRAPSALNDLPPRVAAALGEATYRRIEEEIAACPKN